MPGDTILKNHSPVGKDVSFPQAPLMQGGIVEWHGFCMIVARACSEIHWVNKKTPLNVGGEGTFFWSSLGGPLFRMASTLGGRFKFTVTTCHVTAVCFSERPHHAWILTSGHKLFPQGRVRAHRVRIQRVPNHRALIHRVLIHRVRTHWSRSIGSDILRFLFHSTPNP